VAKYVTDYDGLWRELAGELTGVRLIYYTFVAAMFFPVFLASRGGLPRRLRARLGVLPRDAPRWFSIPTRTGTSWRRVWSSYTSGSQAMSWSKMPRSPSIRSDVI
jgi:hypothetical protein